MIFTRNNVQTAVKDVSTDPLGISLYVPHWRRMEIRSQFRGNDGQQQKEYVDYFMDHDPLASWRRVIGVLDGSRQKSAAEKIRHLAEAVTGVGR